MISRIFSLGLISTVLLMSCGAPQDDGAGDGSPVISRVVDGYLALAVVYHDMNEDGVKNTFEPSAITDKNGFISYNPATGKNYCEDPGAKDYVHCLLVNPEETGSVLIRMEGGYDIVNTVPFEGSMALKTDISQVSPSSPVIGSPVTSLLSKMSDSQLATFLQNESLTLTSANSDYMAFTESVSGLGSANDLKLVKLALRAHKVVDVINSAMKLRYAGDSSLPSDLSSYIYEELIKLVTVTNTTDDMATVLSGGANIDALIVAVESKLNSTPLNLTQSSSTPLNSTIASQITEVATSIDNAFGLVSLPAEPTKNEIVGAMRAVELTTAMARDFTVTLAEVQQATAASADGTFVSELAVDSKADISILINKIKNSEFNTVTPAASLVLRSAIDSLTTGSTLNGQRLSLTNGGDSLTMDFVTDTGTSDSGSVAITPPGETTTVDASWQKLDDYSLLIEVDGVDTMMIKPIKDDLTGTFTYLFDFNNEVIEWTISGGGSGFTDTPTP